MEPHRVIVANEPRLLREMLKRAIRRAPGLQVVGEAAGPSGLESLVEETGAQWVIASPDPGGGLAPALETLLDEHKSLCVVTVACDGGRAQVHCGEAGERTLDGLSLAELVAVLRGPPSRNGRQEEGR